MKKKQFLRVFHPKTVGSSTPKKTAIFSHHPQKNSHFFPSQKTVLAPRTRWILIASSTFATAASWCGLFLGRVSAAKADGHGQNWLPKMPLCLKKKGLIWCLSILFFEPWPYLWAMAKDLVCKSFVDLHSTARYASKWFLYGTLGAFAVEVSQHWCRSVQVVGPTQPRRTGMFSTFQTLCTSSQSFSTKQKCIWKRCGQGTE